MPTKQYTLVNDILEFLKDLGNFVPRPFETPYEHIRRIRKLQFKKYYDTVYNLKSRGAIKVIRQNGNKFIQLTKKGQLEVLLAKAKIRPASKWDGKWRVLTFDIPEDARDKRDGLRRLLKSNNFIKLQASVFINPYPLNREAIRYLKQTGLDSYIRIMRVDELDSDTDLKKKFKL